MLLRENQDSRGTERCHVSEAARRSIHNSSEVTRGQQPHDSLLTSSIDCTGTIDDVESEGENGTKHSGKFPTSELPINPFERCVF